MASPEVIDQNGVGSEGTRSRPVAWRIATGEARTEQTLIDRLGLSPLQARLLVNRGIRTPAAASEFLNPSRRQILPPFLFKNMEKAVDRIRRAIDRNEKIFIFGDRDVDGVSGTAILLTVLRAFGATVDSHIPIGDEGYGVHPDVMARALKDGFTLGITVDTGICEIDRVAQANTAGMDVIIADHHHQQERVPDAYAILHPGVPGEPYPYKYLSGAGVAFKLAMALIASRSPFANRDLVFVDVETTGLARERDEVIEIGALKYRNGVPVDEFSRLIAPVGPLTDEIQKITGITPEDLKSNGVDRAGALRAFLEFLGGPGTLLCGYNVEFDRAFLTAELKRNLGVDLPNPVFDVMAAAGDSLPMQGGRKLGDVAKELGVPLTEAHRALPDARAAADIFHRLIERQDIEQNIFYDLLIPLAALAAVADMMPLDGENRAIVAEGLRLMRDGDAGPLGLRRLLDHLELEAPTGKDMAFLLGPLLNAPGRLGDATPALRLLTATSPDEAERLSKDLVRMNTERKALVKENFRRLIDLVPEQNDLSRDRIICLVAEGLPQGVTGIVATRIKNEFGRPVMIILVENGRGTGSGRSVESLDMVQAVGSCGELVEKFGGHHQAVGLTIHPDRIPAFFERLKKSVAGLLPDLPDLAIDLDAKLTPDQLKLELLDELSALEPFGKGNPFPKFALISAPLAELRMIGDEGQHLRLRIGESARNAVTAVGWNMVQKGSGLGARIDAVFELARNEWKGRTDLQLVLEDIRPTEG